MGVTLPTAWWPLGKASIPPQRRRLRVQERVEPRSLRFRRARGERARADSGPEGEAEPAAPIGSRAVPGERPTDSQPDRGAGDVEPPEAGRGDRRGGVG